MKYAMLTQDQLLTEIERLETENKRLTEQVATVTEERDRARKFLHALANRNAEWPQVDE